MRPLVALSLAIAVGCGGQVDDAPRPHNRPPSCPGSELSTCGRSASEDCCLSFTVPGGTFYRRADADPASAPLMTKYPATVSSFELDRYEVTVGRFRRFVEKFERPAQGAGAHPRHPESGFQPDWPLARSGAELKAALSDPARCKDGTAPRTWTDVPGPNENKPINCVTWYELFAFCAWDGGRLPTDAELHFAASAGKEQRVYPWSVPPASTALRNDHATFGTVEMRRSIADVGMSPAGDGLWGHRDLAGNVFEVTLDIFSFDPPAECVDCIIGSPALIGSRNVRGGSYESPVGLRNIEFAEFDPAVPLAAVGARCARNVSSR